MGGKVLNYPTKEIYNRAKEEGLKEGLKRGIKRRKRKGGKKKG